LKDGIEKQIDEENLPIPAIRQEAATTGSCATNILNFSITGIFVSLSLQNSDVVGRIFEL
jgi:hypothetical protein